jgi:hypothetical protein
VPDFGLTEALARALKASKGVEVMRPAEAKLAAAAAKAAPPAAAPAVPEPVARAPSVQAPPAEPAPGSTQQPPINPSVPPEPVTQPPEDPTAATPAPTDVAGAAADAAPASVAPVASEAPVTPLPIEPAPDAIAPENTLPPPPAPEAPAALSPIEEQARRFVTANIGDFPAERLNMSHMPNVDTMASPDGVKAAILQIAEDNKGAIDESRRGTISDEQMVGLAQDLSLNGDIVKQVLNREFGTQMQRPEVVLAARMLEQKQMGTLMGLAGKVADGSATSEEIAQFEQTAQLVQQFRIQLSGAVAEQGRGLRVMSLPVGLPTDVMDHVAQVLKQNNPDQQAMAQAIRLAGTPSGIANIVQGMQDMPMWVRAGKATQGLLQRIFINGILSGPPTWLKIIVGNNVNLLANATDLYVAGIGRGMAGLAARIGGYPTAAEGVTLSDAYAHVHGVISGGADALRVAGRVLRTGQSLDGIMRAGEAGNANSFATALPEIQGTYFGSIMKGIENVIDVPGSRIISPLDELTKTMGFRGYKTMMALKEIRAKMLDGTLKAEDAAATMEEMMQRQDPALDQAAEDWAHRMTFQSPFAEGGGGEAFQNLINKVPALRFIFPFMRTATNIFKQSLGERTPLAIFSARIRAQIANGGFEGDLAKSRIATGTAIGGMLAWMAIHDRITGPAPKDPKERALWTIDGRTPYSVRVTDPITGKDTWRDYSWFEPMATIAGTMADIVKTHAYLAGDSDTLMPQENRLMDAASHVMASIITNTGDKTFMQGASQFSEMYNDPNRAFGMWADQMGAAMVPMSGATKFVRNEQDPYMRQAFSILDKVKDQLPTVAGVDGSRTLQPRLNVFGEPRVHKGGNSILGPLNPMAGSDSTSDELTDEIATVMDQTRTVPITMPSQQLSMPASGSGRGIEDGGGMRLTPEEYNDYVTKSRADPIFPGGLTFREQLEKTIALPLYQKATPAVRVELLAQVQRQADRIGRQHLFEDNKDFAERLQAWTAEKNRIRLGQ